MGKLILENESYALRGAVFEVYRELGCGFLEAVYQKALEHEFSVQNIPFVAQPQLKVRYKDVWLDQVYIPDFICFDEIIIELKAVQELTPVFAAQLKNYLKATGLHVGFLVNFGSSPKAEITRIVL